MKDMKGPFLSAVAFFWTLGILSVGYSAYVANYPATATPSTQLSSSEWNKMVSALQTLDGNLSNLSFSSGKVGIGTPSPQANLEVAGSIKFGGKQISRITVCSFWGTPNSTLANRFYHYWTGAECDNGLPSWSCLGFITKAWHNGSDQDWEVVFPGEDPGSAGWVATNGGMAWWTASSWAGLGIRATYMCQ